MTPSTRNSRAAPDPLPDPSSVAQRPTGRLSSMKGSKTRSTRIPPQKYPTDGEKLERIPRGIDAPLHLNGNFGAEEDVHIGVHEWNADPPEDRAETPDGRTAPEGEEKILRAHGQKQGIADDAHPAFGWRHDGDKDASSSVARLKRC